MDLPADADGWQAHLQLYEPGHGRGFDGQYAEGALEDEQHGEQVEVESAERQLVQQNHACRRDAVCQAGQHLRRRDQRVPQRREAVDPTTAFVPISTWESTRKAWRAWRGTPKTRDAAGVPAADALDEVPCSTSCFDEPVAASEHI